MIGKIINIGSRCAKFINEDFDNQLSESIHNESLIKSYLSIRENIVNGYENRNYSTNIRLISKLADDANKYIDDEKPWVKIKNEKEKMLVQKICTDGLNLFRILAGYLKPVLPKISEKVEKLLICDALDWKNIKDLQLSKKIQKFKPILKRIEKESIDKMKEEANG